MPMEGREFVVVTDDVSSPLPDGAPTLSADEYLEGAGAALEDGLAVVNLCRSYRYLSKGYYVSLLADARRQPVFPSLDMGLFGRAAHERSGDACEVLDPPRRAPAARSHRIACLWDPDDPFAASDADTLEHFADAARRNQALFERIGPNDLRRLGEYDALFIRSVTAIEHYSFRFAQTAASLGMPVIDDPRSILKCTNKVYLHELFRHHRVAAPHTVAISPRTAVEGARALGFPLIVKLPDGTFSRSVKKADNEAQFEAITREMFSHSPLLVLQEFVPTPFDWRVGVLDGRVLFACKYHMAEGHWQIVSVSADGETDYGRVEAVPTHDVPGPVLALALESAALVGRGLYGIDVKETDAGPAVIEVNDNPNIQAGYEDAVEGGRIYDAVVATLVARIGAPALNGGPE